MNAAGLVVLCLAVLAASAEDEIQSSINAAGAPWHGNPLRFFGLTKTLATTTTVVTLNTVYVHPTCTVVAAGTPPCAVAPPVTTTTPAPTTTTTPSPTTPTTASTGTTGVTTQATTTSAKPFIQIIPGGTSQLLSGSLTVNKVNPPTLQVNLPQLGGGSGGGGFNLFGNKPPINMNLAAGVSAAINSAGNAVAGAAGGAAAAGRRRRSSKPAIQPSIVKAVEMTAVPEMRSAPEESDIHLEASQFLHHQGHHDEFEIIGLSPEHMANRALPPLFGSPITIVKLARVTVTATQTVTSVYPVSVPADRVTLTISGCVPASLPAGVIGLTAC